MATRAHGLASRQPLERLGPLIGIELVLAAEPYARRLGALAPGIGASLDQGMLEFGKAAENRQHQFAVRRRGIGPSIGERLEGRARLGDGVHDIEQITGRSSEAIEPRYDHHVASAERLDHFRKLRAIGAKARNLLLVDHRRASRPERGDLIAEALAVRADAGITVNGHFHPPI